FATLELERMGVSKAALREGVLHDMLGRGGADDPRDASVLALMQRYGIDATQAERVAGTALQLFDRVSRDWSLDAEDRLMLARAARLHELGLAIAHSQYQVHGAYVLQHSDIAGFSVPEQRVLAALVRNHRRKVARSALDVVPDRLLPATRRLTALLRLAVLLHRSHDPAPLPDLRLFADGSTLTLSLPAQWIEVRPLLQSDLVEEPAAFEPLGIALRFEFRPCPGLVDQRLARHLLLAHRRVVDHAGDDRRGLLEVLRRRVIVGVQVGVVDVGAVVQAILHELEARKPDAVERDVVGAAGVARDHHGGADVGERLHPRLEDRHRGEGFLGVHAADLARAVVQVEVGREPVVRRLALQLAVVFAQEGRQVLLRRIGGLRIRGEGTRNVVGRTDQALLLTAPQRDADGAARLDADLLEDAHGLHHHRHAGAVVGRAAAGVPGVHVRAEHHHFIGLGAAARDLGDGVVAVAVLVGGEARIHVHAQAHGLAIVQRA